MGTNGRMIAQRLKSRALWAFIVGGICLGATLVGLAQYIYLGKVSIRPGHDPLMGSAALKSLLAFFLVSSGFLACGFILRARARRRVSD